MTAALRIPPHSIESEQSVIGGLLLDNGAIDRVGSLRPEHFYRDDHRRIYTAICALIAANKPADVITVFDALEQSGEAERVGGLAYLGDIANNTPSAANIRRYAESVVDRALLRALQAAGDDIAARSTDPLPTNEKIDYAQSRIMALCEQATTKDPRGVREVMIQSLDRIQKMQDGEIPPGLLTGFSDVDSRCRVLKPSSLIILAARPGMGKTAFALRIAANVAETGTGVLFCSMEMEAQQLTDRLISSHGRVPFGAVIGEREFQDGDMDRITMATARIARMNLSIDDQSALTLWDVRTKARQVQRRSGLGLIVIDYLQLMRGEGENRTQEVGSISRGLKALAKDMGVPVIALSQLNRGLESRPNKRPVMSDLRESGDIEQDADVVWGLYRDEVYNPDSAYKGLAELLWLKNRSGEAGGNTPLAWIGEHVFYGNADRAAYQEASARSATAGVKGRHSWLSNDD